MSSADPKNPGSLIRDRVRIAHTYFKGWFCLDLVSIFPFDMIGLFAGADMSSLKIVKVCTCLWPLILYASKAGTYAC